MANQSEPSALLSLAAGTVLDVEDPVRVVEIAAEAGYDGVGLRLSLDRTTSDTGRRISRVLARTGITLLDVEVVRVCPGAGLDEPTRRLADLAAELQARYLLTVSLDPEPTRTAATLQALAERLEGSVTRPVLEFMRFTAVPTLAAAEEILGRLAAGRVRLLLDVLHLVRSGGAVDAATTVVPGRIAYAQLCDAPGSAPAGGPDALADEARTRRLLPGEGGLPLARFLRSIPERTPVSVEVQSRELQTQLAPVERAVRCLAATRSILAEAASRPR